MTDMKKQFWAEAGSPGSMFPSVRARRLRRTKSLRDLVRETIVVPADLVYPLFVVHGKRNKIPIGPMPGQFQLSIDHLVEETKEIQSLGIKSVLLFGLPKSKDNSGTGAYDPNGIIQEAVSAIKNVDENIVVMTDVCLCEYTTHGHCGVLSDEMTVNNDKTIELLGQIAASHAEAGADIVAPSAMMDGQVMAIRSALDQTGHQNTAILAYSAKMSSSFYGPFRIAADSAPAFGDRRGYQMDGANGREAMRELRQDADEGADMVMVKPALAYLDMIAQARQSLDLPIAAYNVSGEYSMLKAAFDRGWLEEKPTVIEVLSSIKRAGADLILTYFAKDMVRYLREEES